jgi:SAM-dependent methyltransferase
MGTEYEILAAEYYDASRHPTCANFREASALLAQEWVSDHMSDMRFSCEVGCGKSLLAEIISDYLPPEGRLMLVDSSPSMLAYSRIYHGRRNGLALGEAERLPFRAGAIDAILFSLGDPYNTQSFWAEVKRVLAHKGTGLFTTPAFAWMQNFREGHADKMRAEFDLNNGQKVCVPSMIYPRDEQRRRIEVHGLVVGDVIDIPVSALRHTTVSPKLITNRGPGLPIVTGYFITNP